MNAFHYSFTIFTPTFNRAYLLENVYSSLKQQTFRDFEWLIVDDGSIDNTRILVEQWTAQADFPIRYFYQENKGKHYATNLGVREAQGEFFLTLDSDDRCLPNALERFKHYWDTIPAAQKPYFSAVTALCQDYKGNIVGDKYPSDILDSDSIEIREKFKVRGEKWGFQKTILMRQFPFPEYPGEKFIPESVVWDVLSVRYKTRFVNEALRIYEALPSGLTKRAASIRASSPRGAAHHYRQEIQVCKTFKARFKAAINYGRFCLHGKRIPFCERQTIQARIMVLIGLPFAILFFLSDQLLIRKEEISARRFQKKSVEEVTDLR